MKKSYKILLLCSIMILIPLVVFGDPPTSYSPSNPTSYSPLGFEIENPLNADSFTELLVNIINWVGGIASTVAVLMVVIAGFQYMISGGDENKTKSAMNTIKWSLIGLLIVLMSWAILKEVLSILNG